MKIVQCITRMIVGGAQEVVVMNAAAMVRRGHEVTVVHGPTSGPEGSLLDAARAAGARLIEVPSLVRPVAPLTDWRCRRALRRLFTDLAPQVVHTHSSKAGIVGRAAAWSAGVPCVVHTVHGLGFHDGQSAVVRDLYVRSERWAARRCHHLIAVSPQMVAAFEANRIASRQRMTVVPSAVDLARFGGPPGDRAAAKAALGIDPASPVIAVLARLDRLKGHTDLLDALPAVAARHPAVQVVFIGDGYDRPAIEQAIADRGLGGRVRLLGRVERDAVPTLLDAAEVSVLPSHQEGQSITLLQSLLRGCGIVAYDVGGIPSVCIDGQTGRLVPKGDTAALADAIVWLLDHPEQRDQLVEQGQALARLQFSPQRMTDATLGVYDRILIENEHREAHP